VQNDLFDIGADLGRPERSGLITPAVIRYMNRLSDLLFVLARHENESDEGDVLWHPGAGRQSAPPPGTG